MKSEASYATVPQAERPPRYVQDARAADLEAEDEWMRTPASRWLERVKKTLYLSSLVMLTLVVGYCLGRNHEQMKMNASGGGHSAETTTTTTATGKTSAGGSGLMSPQDFLPEIPMKEVTFEFPTPYENTSVEADKLWDALMPIGSGFVRVPYPRRFDMPVSKTIEDDEEEAEIYSLSMLHQLHCLGVVRDVIKKYEKNEPSRFAGAGHEYHCIDYLRQAIMCSGDTTLDYAEMHEDGTRRGFSGAGSTHQCRDWDAIIGWAAENRAGDKKGIA